MADIKQAAKLMQEGRCVQRREFESGPNATYCANDDGEIVDLGGERLVFTLGDLLAEDWEVAE